ncbi:MAG: hypothetical protein ACFBZ8_13775 [Opitutales bacterium]
MDPIEPFLVPVNAAGLPLDFCPVAPDGRATLSGFTAEALARHYWLLERVDVAYAYTVNGQSVVRNWSMISEPVPGAERLCVRPRLRYDNALPDDPVNFVITARLEVGSPQLSVPFDETYAIVFGLVESDFGPDVILSLEAQPGYQVAAAFPFGFLGNNLTAVLSLLDETWTGSIDSLTLTPVWAEVSN